MGVCSFVVYLFSIVNSILGLVGRVTVSVVPLPTVLSTVIFPPCASTMRLQVASPSPIPLAFVVVRGENAFIRMSSGMPAPVSLKMISTFESFWVFWISMVPFSAMASMEFCIMLAKTFSIFWVSREISELSVVLSSMVMRSGT